MAICQCLKSDRKPCTRETSQKSNHDPRFCWQHQNCKTFKSSSPTQSQPVILKSIENLIKKTQEVINKNENKLLADAKPEEKKTIKAAINNINNSQMLQGNLIVKKPEATPQPIIEQIVKKVNQELGEPYTVDSFEKIQMLGEGAFGQVYSARNKATGKTLVIKKIPKAKTDKSIVDKEIAILSYLKPFCYKYILCYEDSFEDTENTYLITEYLGDFVTLNSYIGTDLITTVLEPSRLVNIIGNLILGLREIHKLKVAHRDIKPENILVSKTGSEIKYIDFGLACFKNGCRLGDASGTPSYMAPEIYLMKKDIYDLTDLQRADIWSLGTTIVTLMQGETPFIKWALKILTTMLKEDEQTYKMMMDLPKEKRTGLLLSAFYKNDQYLTGVDQTTDDQLVAIMNGYFNMFLKFSPPFSLGAMLERDPSQRRL